MYIDTVSVQMQSKTVEQMGTIVEAGVVVSVNDRCPREGYYYVSIYYGEEDGQEHLVYSVTLESMREWLYGYCVGEDDPPYFVERYDSIDEIEESAFCEVFYRLKEFEKIAGEKLN